MSPESSAGGGPQVLAVIPARGGSKSIPGKNLRRFAGHPLLAYGIAAGLQAETVSRVIVSTDDEEIARAARAYGAEVPFLRPAALAQDDSLDLPVFQHVLEALDEQEGYRPEIVVQLRPTSPLRPPDCVDAAVDELRRHPEADSVRGVVPSGQNPYKMWRIAGDGRLEPLLKDVPEAYNRPRQSLPPTFWQTGHVDAVRASVIRSGSMSGSVIRPLPIDPAYTVDIDTLADWRRAEMVVRQSGLAMVRPGRKPRPLPARPRLLILDFDGVLTDNRVWVDGEGREAVAASRADGMGLERLRAAGVKAVVVSSEIDRVVEARCRKLNLPFRQGVTDKALAVDRLLQEESVPPESTVFVGNDRNDLAAFGRVGCAVAVADAAPEVLAAADLVLDRPGGRGAVRELCDILIERMEATPHDA